jgi:CO/xanthine dehydrogenase Mo-binding subunit
MTYTGRDVRRLEDPDLLRGAGRFADDLPVRRDTLHAAILRSPHAHAEIFSIHMVRAYRPSTAAARFAEETRQRAAPRLTKPDGRHAAGPEVVRRELGRRPRVGPLGSLEASLRVPRCLPVRRNRFPVRPI